MRAAALGGRAPAQLCSSLAGLLTPPIQACHPALHLLHLSSLQILLWRFLQEALQTRPLEAVSISRGRRSDCLLLGTQELCCAQSGPLAHPPFPEVQALC